MVQNRTVLAGKHRHQTQLQVSEVHFSYTSIVTDGGEGLPAKMHVQYSWVLESITPETTAPESHGYPCS